MSEIKHKNQILAAIEHLRSRKARPDIGRICKFMLRAYKVNPRDTRADLKRCVRERSIIKVDYKDNVSYRNAATWKRASYVMANERRIITSAIATLIYQDQSYLENGIAFEDLVQAAASQDSKFTKKQLEGIIQKELSSGSLVQLPNGNLALGPADHDGDSSDSGKIEYNADSNIKMTSSANSSCRSSPQQRMRGRPKKRAQAAAGAGVRVGERRKMAKKVFDPSDNHAPSKRKRGRPAGSLNKSTLKRRLLGARAAEPPRPLERDAAAGAAFLRPHERELRVRGRAAPPDARIPDVAAWTTHDVFDYFSEHFPEAAPVLKEQEFDGEAISMARRADIVSDLGLPLGPALLLYRIIVKLQTRRDDWTMCWG